jgi:hypothetical protein
MQARGGVRPPSLHQAALVGVLAGMSCWSYAEHHCANLQGDSTCAERGAGRFCDACRAEGDGCSDAPPREGCGFAGPEAASATMGTTLDGTAAPGTAAVDEAEEELDEAGEVDDSPPPPIPCATHDDCPGPGAPFCHADGECVACDAMPAPDAACAERDEARPVCAAGACVQCSAANTSVCEAQRQVCDEPAGTCRSCAEHGECHSGACELAVGLCFPPSAAVLEVGGAAGYPSVGVAVNAIPSGGIGIVTIHETETGAPYAGAPIIGGGRTVALLAAEGEAPTLRGVLGTNPALRVEGADTVVYLEGLALRGTTAGHGLVVTAGTAWVDRSRIVENRSGGVLAREGAEVTIRSSFVGGNESAIRAVDVQGSTARVVYSTLGAGLGNAAAIACDAASTVEVRSSVLVAQTAAPEVECEGTFEHNAAELVLGGTNTAVGPMSMMWFTGYANGDFWLTAAGSERFAGVAQWEAGDPRTDIDGDLRPTVDGSPDVAGADLLP